MNRRGISIAIAFSLAFTCVSCLERTEEIVVSEDGTATIIARFDGNAADILSLAVPSEPEWTIISRDIDSSDVDAIRMELVAELVVPYGTPLPGTYAKPDAADKEINLQFPTELRRWTEGGRTYYEFERTYLARSYSRYDVTCFLIPNGLWNQELEDRVIEKGIFEVSEKDREEYLDQFSAAFSYQHWRFLWETLTELYRRGRVPVSTKEDIETWAADYLESVITPVRLLGIAGKDDDSIGVALDRLGNEVHNQFAKYFSEAVGADQKDVQQEFDDLFDLNIRDYDVTKTLGAHKFAIALELPGTIIRANGLIDHHKPGVVEWYFKGEDLYDKHIPLYALSVVEN